MDDSPIRSRFFMDDGMFATGVDALDDYFVDDQEGPGSTEDGRWHHVGSLLVLG